MGKRTKYTPGTFSWTDLTSPDQDGAKAFYTALFGWDARDNDIGNGAVYSEMLVDGTAVCAISPQPPQQQGGPPIWNSYVSVDSADDTLARATELGGSVHAPAFEVFGAGRMGVVQDPQGAYFCAWEPQAHIGAGLVNGHGMLSWNELHTPDVDAAASFYGDLFGWTAAAMDMGEAAGHYSVVSVDGHANGGISDALGPGAPPHWLVYFGSDDLDGSLSKIAELGGTVIQPAMEIMEGNRIAVAQDPQGGWFAVYAGQFED
jgi:predicted enzyme related to lactoylglutathione lyase